MRLVPLAAVLAIGLTITTAPATADLRAAVHGSSHSTVAPAQAAQHAPAPRPGPGSVSVLHVADAGVTRDVWVYRPAVPDSATLPVLYFLHGLPGSPADIFTQGGAGAVDSFIAAGGTPFVLASPDGRGTARFDTEWADGVDGRDRVETFVTGAVIAAVEGTNPRPRARRAIAGFSMGGYGAMNIALRHPDLYGAAVSIAGYFHVDDPDGVFNGDAGTVAANSPDQHAVAAHDLDVLLLDGDADDQPLARGEAQRFKTVLDQSGIPATLVVSPGRHRWAYVMRELPTTLTWLGSCWTATPASVPGTSPR